MNARLMLYINDDISVCLRPARKHQDNDEPRGCTDVIDYGGRCALAGEQEAQMARKTF